MIISHKHKFIFIKTNKTAGTSMQLFLAQFCGDQDVLTALTKEDLNYRPRNETGLFNPFKDFALGGVYGAKHFIKSVIGKKKKFYNHIPACLVKERLPKKIWDTYFKFCFERNPWDKTVSDYFFQNYFRGTNISFEKYIQRGQFPLNSLLYTENSKSSRPIVDFIGKYENLSEDFSKVCEIIGIPFKGELGYSAKANIRDKKHYKEFFDQNAKQKIEKIFFKEIQMHKYNF